MKIKRVISIFCVVFMLISMPMEAYAASIDHDMTLGSLDIKENGDNYEYTYYYDGPEAKTGSSAKSEGLEVNVTQSGEEATTNRIVVGDGVDVTLNLEDVHILVDVPVLEDEEGNPVEDEWGDLTYLEEYDPHGIELGNGDVTINLIGDNSVGSESWSNNYAAIHEHDGNLTITSETGGTLYAYYDTDIYVRTAIIGGDYDEEVSGNITVNGNAELTILNTEHGAAIGTYSYDKPMSGDITIGGEAKLNLHAQDDSALGGSIMTGNITIEDSAEVVAYSGPSAAIGGDTVLGDITISGDAKVTAVSAAASGIGGRDLQGDIIIEGNAQVNAINKVRGTGIGASGGLMYGGQDGVMGGDIIIRDDAKVYAEGKLVGIGSAGAMSGDITIEDNADVTAVGGTVAVGAMEELYSSALCSWCNGTDVCKYCSGDGDCDICGSSGVCAECSGSGDCPDCDGFVECEDCAYHKDYWYDDEEGGSSDRYKGFCNECYGAKECQNCYGVGCPDCYGEGTCGSCGGTLVCGHCDYDDDFECEDGECEVCCGEGVCDTCGGTGEHDYCNGTGERECWSCEGSGVCEECDGTAEMDCWACYGKGNCSDCDGAGKYTCYNCDGTGFDICWSCFEDESSEGCADCGGTGYSSNVCYGCDGRGTVNCSCGGSNKCWNCGGSGKEDCYYCNYTGNCGSCEGTGKTDCYCKEEGYAGKCYDCEGSGDCYECEGTGYCSYCGGTRQCNECNLSGICLTCEGDGICDVCQNSGNCSNCGGTGRCPNDSHCKTCLGTGYCLDCEGSKECRHCDDAGNCSYCGGEGSCSHCNGALYCILPCCYDGSVGGTVVSGNVTVKDNAILRTAGRVPVGPNHDGYYGEHDNVDQSVTEYGKENDVTTMPEVPEMPEVNDNTIIMGEKYLDWDELRAINIEGYYDSEADKWYMVNADGKVTEELVDKVKDICAEKGVDMSRVVIFGEGKGGNTGGGEPGDKEPENIGQPGNPGAYHGRGYIIWNEIEDISAVFNVSDDFPKDKIASYLIEEELKEEYEELLLGGIDESKLMRYCNVWDNTDMGIRVTMRFHFDKSYIGQTMEIRWVEDGELKTFEGVAVEDEIGRAMVLMDKAPMGDYVVVLK